MPSAGRWASPSARPCCQRQAGSGSSWSAVLVGLSGGLIIVLVLRLTDQSGRRKSIPQASWWLVAGTLCWGIGWGVVSFHIVSVGLEPGFLRAMLVGAILLGLLQWRIFDRVMREAVKYVLWTAISGGMSMAFALIVVGGVLRSPLLGIGGGVAWASW